MKKVLQERGNRYGPFDSFAKISQDMKRIIRAAPSYGRLSDKQVEALEMIVHKIARILNGDPAYEDSWVDIAGYAERGRGIDYRSRLAELAEQSPCKKRKVGALTLDDAGNIIGEGYNTPPDGFRSCEDEDGVTYPDVVHAEINALAPGAKTMYATHVPCMNCADQMHASGVTKLFYMNDSGSKTGSRLAYLRHLGIEAVAL